MNGTSDARPHYRPDTCRIHPAAWSRQFVALPERHLLALDSKVAHDVEALEESVFLLTLARRNACETGEFVARKVNDAQAQRYLRGTPKICYTIFPKSVS